MLSSAPTRQGALKGLKVIFDLRLSIGFMLWLSMYLLWNLMFAADFVCTTADRAPHVCVATKMSSAENVNKGLCTSCVPSDVVTAASLARSNVSSKWVSLAAAAASAVETRRTVMEKEQSMARARAAAVCEHHLLPSRILERTWEDRWVAGAWLCWAGWLAIRTTALCEKDQLPHSWSCTKR